MQERNHAYKEYQISVCKDYDPSRDKLYNNDKVAYRWYTTTLEWTEKAIQELTTQQAVSNIFSDGHKANESWVKTTYIMLDSDDGKITADELIDQQSKWQFDSYIYTSQNHQKEKNGLKCDRLRVLIPLMEPIDNISDLEAVKEYFIDKFPWTDNSFMGRARYFAHGTRDVSSFVGDKGPLNWKNLPDLDKYRNRIKKAKKTSWKKSANNEIKISNVVLDSSKAERKILDVIPGESIYCPVCGMSDDRSGDQHNATIMINDEDLPFLFCQSCKSRGNGNDGVYNFDDTDALIYRYNLEDKIVFIDEIKSTYYTGSYEQGSDEFKLRDRGGKEHVVQFCKFHKIPVPDTYPRARVELIFDSDKLFDFSKGYVNRYSATDLIKSQIPAGHVAKLPHYIGKLIDHILAHDKDIIERFYNDIAWWIQKREKLITAHLMQGTEGTGKGLFFDNVIRPIIGPQFSAQSDQDAFGKEFNSYLQENIALLINEVSGNFSGNKDKELKTVERMKQAITDKNIFIEDKGIKRVIGKNHCTMFFATNRRHALTLAEDDRRFNVAPRQEVKITKTSWWPGYFKMIEHLKKELQEFVFYLKQYQVDESLIGKVIDNEPKRILQTMSQTNADMFFDAVKKGDLEWLCDNVSKDNSRDSLEKNIKIENMLKSLSGSDKCKTDDLCLLYNNINGKTLTPVAFGRMASGYIGKAKQMRFGTSNKKGFSIQWDEIDDVTDIPF